MRTLAKMVLLVFLICLVALPASASTIVIRGGCDVFLEPSTASTVVGHVETNQEMLYIGAWRYDDQGMCWYEVEYDGYPGWVPARYGELYSETSEYMSHMPSDYIGEWQSLEGGADYSEYYLNIYDFVESETFVLSFDIYRMWGFDEAMAVIEGEDYATLVAEDDQYQAVGKLVFLDDGLALTILFSDCPYLDADTYIVFRRT